MFAKRFGKPASLFIGGAASFVLLSGCETVSQPAARGEIAASVVVRGEADASGAMKYTYSGDFVDESGNLDFSTGAALHNTVRLTFTIHEASAKGLAFKSDGADAMWIVEKSLVGEESPEGPYRGNQFTDFKTSPDGRSLSVTDFNNDETLYRYALRFNLNGKTVAHDPDVQNGGHD